PSLDLLSFPTRRSSDLDEVGKVLLHVGSIGVAVDGAGVGLSVPYLVAQLKKGCHGGPGARNILLHFVNKGVNAKGHLTVILFVGDRKSTRLNSSHVSIS